MKKPTPPKTFQEWFAANKPSELSKKAYVLQLQDKSGVSRTTILHVLHGLRLQHYGKAQALAALTGLPVTVFVG